MLSDNITVKNRANSDVTYRKTLDTRPGTVTRTISGGTKAEPETLTISQQVTGKAPNQRSKTLAQLAKRKATTSGFADLIINLTVNQPYSGDFTSAEILDYKTRLLGVFSTSGDAHAVLDSTVVAEVFTQNEG